MIYDFIGGKAIEVNKHEKLELWHQKLETGEGLTNTERGTLGQMLADYNGIYKHFGWCYNFREFMTLYCVKTQHNGVLERWAFNKTQARLDCKMCGRIYYIVEVTTGPKGVNHGKSKSTKSETTSAQ